MKMSETIIFALLLLFKAFKYMVLKKVPLSLFKSTTCVQSLYFVKTFNNCIIKKMLIFVAIYLNLLTI